MLVIAYGSVVFAGDAVQLASDVYSHRSESMKLLVAFAVGSLVASASGCGHCVGVGVTRLSDTERTIVVGQSFVVTYEVGGSCTNTFAPSGGQVRWRSTDSTIVQVDSVTGRVTGKCIGDATVLPDTHDFAPLSLLVHVR